MRWKALLLILTSLVSVILFFTGHTGSVIAAIVLAFIMWLIKIIYDINKKSTEIVQKLKIK